MTRRWLTAVGTVWLFSQAGLLLAMPAWMSALVWLLGALFVPGVLLVTLLLPADAARRAPLATLLYGLGAGSAVLSTQLLLLSYLPGGLSGWHLRALGGAIVGLLWALHWRRTAPTATTPIAAATAERTVLPLEDRRLWLAALAILLLAVAVRAPQLGYAEFHGDEARAVLRAAAVVQAAAPAGAEEVLFLHRKGPVEVLLPAAQFAFGTITSEAAARLPFLLANVGALLVVLLLGWRIHGLGAGIVAALLLTVDGYSVAFARFVQYQSVVLLMTSLATLALVEVVQQARQAHAPMTAARLRPPLLLAALFMATGLLAHYDAALGLAPLLVLWIALLASQQVDAKTLVRASLPGLALGSIVLALYYLPLPLLSDVASTFSYLRDERIVGGGLPVNNLGDFALRGLLYSSVWQMMALAGLGALAYALTVARGYGKLWSALLAGVALIALVAAGWTVTNNPLASSRAGAGMLLGVFALVFALACCAPRQRAEARALWVWLAVGALGMLFLVATPRTHVHIFYVPWALLCGFAARAVWRWLRAQQPVGSARARWGSAFVIAALATVMLLSLHPLTYFTSSSEALRTGSAFDWLFPRPAATAQVDGRFGFPFANGWKAVGALYAEDALSGDFESNQRYAWVPAWYLRGQRRCSATAQWFFAGDAIEPWAQDNDVLLDGLAQEGFARWGEVTVGGAPRMLLLHAGATDATQVFPLEAYAASFDARADASLPLAYPVIVPPPGARLTADFDHKAALEGFTLTPDGPYRAGATVMLDLHWRASSPMPTSYTVFVQAYDASGTKAAQSDSLPVCNQEPTTAWSPGDVVVDTHPLMVEQVLQGEYDLYVGLYDAVSGARLPVVDAAGHVVDDKVRLTSIVVE